MKTTQNYTMSIVQRLRNLAIKVEATQVVRIVATFMIVICALSVHADKLITLHFADNLEYPDAQTATWSVFQTTGILVSWFFCALNPYKEAYLVPIYIFSIQLYWVFSPKVRFDDALLQTYALGACLLFVFILYIVSRFNTAEKRREKQIQEALTIVKELADQEKINALTTA